VFVLFLPWLAIFVWQFSSVQHSFWIEEPQWTGLFGAFHAYAGSRALAGALGLLAAAGAVRTAQRHAGRAGAPPPLVVVAPWLLAPIAIPLALSRFSAPIYLPKYTIAASVPFAILAADGVDLVPGIAGRAAVLALVGWLSVAPLQRYFGTAHKDDWRHAVPAVERQAQPDDLLLFYPYFQQIPFDYYRQRTDTVERAFPLFGPPPPDDGWDRTFERAVGRHRRVWLVTLANDPTRSAVIDQFQRRFTELRHEQVQHVDVYLFAARASPPGLPRPQPSPDDEEQRHQDHAARNRLEPDAEPRTVHVGDG
jgi:hypothetical protein